MTAPAGQAAGGDRLITLVQGEIKVSQDPCEVFSTILGSCVAACIYDSAAGVGGMNHFLLPDGVPRGPADLKYGSMAMELLINELLKAGAQRSRLHVKLFGGGRVSLGQTDIGAKNIEFARRYIHREGFPLVSESVGGQQARRVHFRAASGQVSLMMVPPADAPPEISDRRRRSDPDVTLF